jgi:hypothetical protein
MLQVDWQEKRLIMPAHQLQRLYVIGGYSTLPAISQDASHVAFINGRKSFGQGRIRYNLVVAKVDGTVKTYLQATTAEFSRPAFVGTTVLANQLFDDRYETTLVDMRDYSARQIATLHHTPSALNALDHKELAIAE